MPVSDGDDDDADDEDDDDDDICILVSKSWAISVFTR
jgi:hypothetical protein